MAEKALQEDLTLKRLRFKPSVVVRGVMEGNPDFTRKSLSNGAKLLVEEETYEGKRDHLLSLEREGQMFRSASPDAAELWGSTLVQLPDDPRKFALNSARAGYTPTQRQSLSLGDNCPLCEERQTLIHVLNICSVALRARRYIQLA